MSDLDDDDWDSGFDDVEPALADDFDADVSTVEAQDTVDISAQFFRICARVYPENPVHAPVYAWLSSLPRTSRGNIKSISDHLVLALRLYVDTLNSGASLQVNIASAGSTDVPSVSPEPRAAASVGYSAFVSPSVRYRASRRLRDSLDSSPVTSAPSSSASTSSVPAPSSSGEPSGSESAQTPSYVAKLARDMEGWT